MRHRIDVLAIRFDVPVSKFLEWPEHARYRVELVREGRSSRAIPSCDLLHDFHSVLDRKEMHDADGIEPAGEAIRLEV